MLTKQVCSAHYLQYKNQKDTGCYQANQIVVQLTVILIHTKIKNMPEYCNRHFHNKMLLVTMVIIIFRLVLEPQPLYITHPLMLFFLMLKTIATARAASQNLCFSFESMLSDRRIKEQIIPMKYPYLLIRHGRIQWIFNHQKNKTQRLMNYFLSLPLLICDRIVLSSRVESSSLYTLRKISSRHD